MKVRILAAIFAISSLAVGPASSDAEALHAPPQEVKLPPELLDLLRAEMREVASGMQGIALSLAAGDWKAIQETSHKIRDSYIMTRKLTPAQAAELEQALPAPFKQLDAEFHQRAQKLGAAAAARDPELVVFHYSRMLESCASCHSAYAAKRFPGFVSAPAEEHHH